MVLSLLTTATIYARRRNSSAYFPRQGEPIEDDHLPFLNAGVRALDVIDFQSQSTFWHTPRDTMDKLSARSFEIVGTVLLNVLRELEQQQ